jgi:hypothetical protein
MTEEDEAFEALDKKLNKRNNVSPDDDIMCYRNDVIEEVAARIEHEFKIPFAQDTVASFAAYIREMKR